MTDHLTTSQRSWNMSRIRSENTKPEKIVRSLLHAMGFRFRLHYNELPGGPDVVLPKYKTAIFVHGCFWHRHEGCKYTTTPKTNKEFWKKKFLGNVGRDKQNEKRLAEMKWKVILVWECEQRNMKSLALKLSTALENRERQVIRRKFNM